MFPVVTVIEGGFTTVLSELLGQPCMEHLMSLLCSMLTKGPEHLVHRRRHILQV
jgi:hypothetical protein